MTVFNYLTSKRIVHFWRWGLWEIDIVFHAPEFESFGFIYPFARRPVEEIIKSLPSCCDFSRLIPENCVLNKWTTVSKWLTKMCGCVSDPCESGKESRARFQYIGRSGRPRKPLSSRWQCKFTPMIIVLTVRCWKYILSSVNIYMIVTKIESVSSSAVCSFSTTLRALCVQLMILISSIVSGYIRDKGPGWRTGVQDSSAWR